MKKTILGIAAAALLASSASAFAGGEVSVIKLQVRNSSGYPTCNESIVSKGDGNFSDRTGYAVMVTYVDGRKQPDDNSTWRLRIGQVTYQADGSAVIEADLTEKPAGIAGRVASSQHVALTVANSQTSVIHGANGDDYVLSVRRLADTGASKG